MTNFIWNNGTGKDPVPLNKNQASKLANIIRSSKITKDISGNIGFTEEIDYDDLITLSDYKLLNIIDLINDLLSSITITGDFSNGRFYLSSDDCKLTDFIVPKGYSYSKNDYYATDTNRKIVNEICKTSDYTTSTDKLDFVTFTMVKGRHYCHGAIPVNLEAVGLDSNLIEDFKKYPMAGWKLKDNVSSQVILKKHPTCISLFRNNDLASVFLFVVFVEKYICLYFDESLWKLVLLLVLKKTLSAESVLRNPKLIFTKTKHNYIYKYLLKNGSIITIQNIDKADHFYVCSNNTMIDYVGDFSRRLYYISKYFASTNKSYEEHYDLYNDMFLREIVLQCHDITFTNNTEKYVYSKYDTSYESCLNTLMSLTKILMSSYTNLVSNSAYTGNTYIEHLELPYLKTASINGNYGRWPAYGLIDTPNVKTIFLPEFTSFRHPTDNSSTGEGFLTDMNSMTRFIAPKLSDIITLTSSANTKNCLLSRCTTVEKIVLGKLTNVSNVWGNKLKDIFLNSDNSNLIHFEFKEGTSVELYLPIWNPTNALSETSVDLIKDEYILDLNLVEPDSNYTYNSFACNKDLFLKNFKYFIADRLADLSNSTSKRIGLSSAVYSAIINDSVNKSKEILESKNWTIVNV